MEKEKSETERTRRGGEKEGTGTIAKLYGSLPFKLHVFELAVLRKRGGQLLHCLRMILVHLDTLLQQDHHTLRGGEGRGREGEGGEDRRWEKEDPVRGKWGRTEK